MNRKDDMTVSINGGPEVPMSVVGAALDAVKKKRGKATKQTDLEDDALGGRVPANEAKVGGIAADRLRSLIERVERLDGERREIGADITDIFSEAKSAGFDVPTMRQILKLRRMAEGELQEADHLLDIYRRALGL